MITSAMFYALGRDGAGVFSINIGSLVIDLKPLIIGLQSSVIILPVNVAVVQIFRNLKPKVKKEQGNIQGMKSLEDGDLQGRKSWSNGKAANPKRKTTLLVHLHWIRVVLLYFSNFYVLHLALQHPLGQGDINRMGNFHGNFFPSISVAFAANESGSCSGIICFNHSQTL